MAAPELARALVPGNYEEMSGGQVLPQSSSDYLGVWLMPTALPVSLACICLKPAGKLEEGAGGKQASMRLGAKNPSPNGKWQTRYSAHPGWAAGFISSCGLFAHTPAPGVREAKMLRPTHGGMGFHPRWPPF